MSFKTFVKKVIKAVLPYGVLVLIRRIRSRIFNNHNFHIEVQLVDHCNLNCARCTHFCPIADVNFLDVEKYKKDCMRLSSLAAKKIHTIFLMGGEPLLHTDVVEIINITRNSFPFSVIQIVTNGVLLDKMEPAFWISCNKNNVAISISFYPININIRKISEFASKYNVKVNLRSTNISGRTFYKEVHDPEGKQNKNDSFKKCTESKCHHLNEGKLYKCPTIAYIKYMNKYFLTDFRVAPEDYVDIYKINDTKDILKHFGRASSFCRYCAPRKNNYNLEWGVSKKEISEWI